MPGLDGYELLEYLRPMGTPVIFITAKGTLGDRVRGLNLGADDYIVKPFEVAELVARVESVLRRTGRGGRAAARVGRYGGHRGAQRHQGGRGRWPSRPGNSTFWNSFCATGARHCTATCCSSVFGAARWMTARARWTCTSALRKKLGWQEHIKTVYKVGYLLEMEGEP